MIEAGRLRQLSESEGGNVFLIASGEREAWESMRSTLEVDLWDLFYSSINRIAPTCAEHDLALTFLRDAYTKLDDDFVRGDIILLFPLLAMHWSEDDQVLAYEGARRCESGSNAFLRSRVIQVEGIFCHVLENNLLPTGHLTTRRPEADAACAVAHARALKRAYLVRPESSIVRALEKYHLSADEGVRSEAFFQSASIALVGAVQSTGRDALSAQLGRAEEFSVAALVYDSHRPDAVFLKRLLGACRLLTVFPLDSAAVRAAALELRRLWRRAAFDADPGDDPVTLEARSRSVEAFGRVSHLLEDVAELPRALDPTPRLVAIAEAAAYLAGLPPPDRAADGPSELASSVLVREGFRRYVDEHLKRSLWASLQHGVAKIQQLVAKLEGAREPDLVRYYEEVLAYFGSIEQGRVHPDDARMLAMLARVRTDKTVTELEGLLAEHRTLGTVERFLLDSLSKVAESGDMPAELRAYLGGYPKAQRILAGLDGKIRAAIRDYDPERRINLLNVVKYLLYYQFGVTERRIRTDFLLSVEAGGKGPSAVEADLEDSLFHFLMGTDIAYAIEKQFHAATGRVDLAAVFGDFRFPIEVKREHNDLSAEHMRDSYLAQAATYTRAHDRIGISLVLDLTAKVKGEPLVDLENLVGFIEMSPLGVTVKVDVPDYLVTVIIPGNLPRPSDLSTYSH